MVSASSPTCAGALSPSGPRTRKSVTRSSTRAEGIGTKPSFREAFKRGRRCLIAADAFYEREKKGAPKQPWRITLADGEPFAFAGLWERWETAPDGVPVQSCTIVTTAVVPIPGTSSTERFEENLAAASLHLSNDEFTALTKS